MRPRRIELRAGGNRRDHFEEPQGGKIERRRKRVQDVVAFRNHTRESAFNRFLFEPDTAAAGNADASIRVELYGVSVAEVDREGARGRSIVGSRGGCNAARPISPLRDQEFLRLGGR